MACSRCDYETMLGRPAVSAGCDCDTETIVGQGEMRFVNPEDTGRRMDEVRRRYRHTAHAITLAPEWAVSPTFRRRWRDQWNVYRVWYDRWRMHEDARSEPELARMVEAFNRELDVWRRQARDAGVSFHHERARQARRAPGRRRSPHPSWVSGAGLSIATSVPSYLTPKPTMGGLTAPNIVTPGDAWGAVMRSGPKSGGSRCHIVAGGIPFAQSTAWGGPPRPANTIFGAFKELTPVRGGPEWTWLSGQAEIETPELQDPLLWNPTAIQERMDYVARQWQNTQRDIRAAGEGAVPQAWKASFNRALQAFMTWHNENRESWLALTTGATADQANTYLAELRGWRAQARERGIGFTTPEPGRPRHGLGSGLSGLGDAAKWIGLAVLAVVLLSVVK